MHGHGDGKLGLDVYGMRPDLCGNGCVLPCNNKFECDPGWSIK